MQLSKTELKVISELGKGNKSIIGIAKALKISTSQTYRIAQNLNKKGILKDSLQPEMKTHVNTLFKLLSRVPNLSTPFSGTGIKVFTAIIEPKTIAQIQKDTGLHKTTIFKKINQGRKMSLLIIEKKTYRVNEKLWVEAKEFLTELKKYEESVDKRVPVTSIIYFKNDEEIVFSNKDELDAALTGFSAYVDYGIELLTITYYYYLPKKKLTKEEVFVHSLYATEKEKDIRHIIFIALFYSKFKKELQHIKHPIVEGIKKILKGERIKGYPSLQEIKDRAEVYKIEAKE
jgi:hypothetical protein